VSATRIASELGRQFGSFGHDLRLGRVRREIEVDRPGFLPQIEGQLVAVTIVAILDHQHPLECQRVMGVAVFDRDVRIDQFLSVRRLPDQGDVGHEDVSARDLLEYRRGKIRTTWNALPVRVQRHAGSRISLRGLEQFVIRLQLHDCFSQRIAHEIVPDPLGRIRLS